MGRKKDPRKFVQGPAPRARGSRFYNPQPDAQPVDPRILRAALSGVNPGQFFHVIRKDQDYEVRRAPIVGEGKGPDWMDERFLPTDYSREADARAHADVLNQQLAKHGKIVDWNVNRWEAGQRNGSRS